jgi:putative peptidoglycan lipid II flippase
MVRDMAFAYFLGAKGLMDIWVIAFKVPNLTRRLFGEGAASASFIPVYSEQLREDRASADCLARTVISFVILILAGLVVLGEGGIFLYYRFFSTIDSNRLMLALTATMLPYMIMICVVAIMAGVLNSHRHFAAPAAAPILLNIFIISALLLGDKVLGLEDNQKVFFTAGGVLLAGLAQVAMQIFALRSCGFSFRGGISVHHEGFKKVMLLMGPMILGLTVTQLNTLADDIIAKCFSGSVDKGEFFAFFGRQIQYPMQEGAVSKLYFAQRLYQFPLGVLGISLATAIFPVMSADAARKDYKALCKTVSRGFSAAVFVALPATVGIILLGRPLISAIFQHGEFTDTDTKLTATTLSFYAIGLWAFFSQQIATRAFYSTQDSKCPAVTAAVAVVVNIILNLTLLWFLGTGGLALSTALCSYLQVLILVFVLRKRYGGNVLAGLGSTLFKSGISTVAMGIAAWGTLFFLRNMPLDLRWDITRLAAVVPLSALVYLGTAKLLRNEMLSLIVGTRKK